jgi:hypothetical protein
MVLQARDKNIISALARYGVLSTAQISTMFFSGINHTTVMRRLRKLESEELLLRRSGLKNSMFGWCLTVKAARRFGLEEPCRYSNQNTLAHEVALSDLRLSLERIGLGQDWISETELRRQFRFERGMTADSSRLIPDGLFVAKSKTSGVVAVELELTPKGHARYRKTFIEYAHRNSIKWVWYVVKSSAIMTTVFNQWGKVRRYDDSPELIVSLFSDLQNDPSAAKVHFPDQKVLTVNEYFGASAAQGVSNQGASELSMVEVRNLKSGQEFNPTPDIQQDVPSAVDPSPLHLVMFNGVKGSTATGTCGF